MASLLLAACLYPGTDVYGACVQVHDSIGTQAREKEPVRANTEIDSAAWRKAGLSLAAIQDSAERLPGDTARVPVYKPNPQKALWYSALCPGLGQLYNRRYWKLPVVGAAIVGVAYGIGWNQKYYNAYTRAYRDITDEDPNTNSYLNLLSSASQNIDTSELTNTLKNRQQVYRRSRDLSFIGAIGVYLVCLIDAYVDAQLYDFDISPDLSLLPHTTPHGSGALGGVELSLAFHF